MQYSNSRWQPWVLEEEEALKHIKFACVPALWGVCPRITLISADSYDHGITTSTPPMRSPRVFRQLMPLRQVYSNGDSENILGKAIKQHNLPREELVIMTKVSSISAMR